MNIKTRKNGSIIRERVISWKDGSGRTRLHRVKANGPSKRQKMAHENDPTKLSHLVTPLEIESEGMWLGHDNLDGFETTTGPRQKKVGSHMGKYQLLTLVQ